MRAALLVIGVLLCGCGRRSIAPEPTPAPSASASVTPSAATVAVGDVVTLPFGAPLSLSPAGTSSERATTTLGLVVGVEAGARRLLLADGSSGWTSSPLERIAAARVRLREALDVERFPPGDPRRHDEDQHPWLTFPAGTEPTIVGASGERDALSLQGLRVEAAPFLEQPLLQLRGKSGIGFVHSFRLAVEWPIDMTKLSAVRGIVRRPLLAPLDAALLALAPRAGELTSVLGDDGGEPSPLRALPAPAHKWSGVEAFVHDSTAKSEAIASLAVISDGGAFALVLSRSDGAHASVTVARAAIGSPWIARAEMVDLDGDGLSEWVVELVERTSHGVWSRLLLIGGRSLPGALSGGVIDLGGNLGEGDEDTRFSWFVDGGRAFVARSRGAKVDYRSLGFAAGLPRIDSEKVEVVLVKTFADRSAARAAQAAASDGRIAFPVAITNQPWALGRCFLDRTAATKWASAVGGRLLGPP